MGDELPPLPPALVLYTGVGNPEWVHVGVDARLADFGLGANVGTIGLAHDVTVRGRWYPPRAGGGLYLEAAGSFIRMAPQSDRTPTNFNPMLGLGVGYQLRCGQLVFDLGLGIPPQPLQGGLNQPLFVTNASRLPGLRLEVGYAF